MDLKIKGLGGIGGGTAEITMKPGTFPNNFAYLRRIFPSWDRDFDWHGHESFSVNELISGMGFTLSGPNTRNTTL
jgi:hypothetical protein